MILILNYYYKHYYIHYYFGKISLHSLFYQEYVEEIIEILYQKIYKYIESDQFNKLGEIEDGLSFIFSMQENHSKIATWPWSPGTINRFNSTIILPLILGLIQQLISRRFYLFSL